MWTTTNSKPIFNLNINGCQHQDDEAHTEQDDEAHTEQDDDDKKDDDKKDDDKKDDDYNHVGIVILCTSL